MNPLSNSVAQPITSSRQTERFIRLEKEIRNSVDDDEDIHEFNRNFKYELHPEEALTLSNGIFY